MQASAIAQAGLARGHAGFRRFQQMGWARMGVPRECVLHVHSFESVFGHDFM